LVQKFTFPDVIDACSEEASQTAQQTRYRRETNTAPSAAEREAVDATKK